ncbi:hypothetical protein D3C80_1696710 [compost metagenome]
MAMLTRTQAINNECCNSITSRPGKMIAAKLMPGLNTSNVCPTIGVRITCAWRSLKPLRNSRPLLYWVSNC